MSTVASDKHECQATDVSGIKGGKLMCETRNETRVTYKNEQETSEPVKMPRPKRIPTQSEPPVAKSDGAWTHVKSARPNGTGTGRGATGRGATGRGAGRGSTGGRGRGQKRDTV